jgi:dienelactone hydrolase
MKEPTTTGDHAMTDIGLDDVMRRHADRLADPGHLPQAVDLLSAGETKRCQGLYYDGASR